MSRRILLGLSCFMLLACAASADTVPLRSPQSSPQQPSQAASRRDRVAVAPTPESTGSQAKPQPQRRVSRDFEPIPLTAEDLARIRKVQPIVRRAADRYGIDPHLINAVIWVESKFHPRARGSDGASGLMQLMPRTSRSLAKKLGLRHRPFDPEFNIMAGGHYLGRLMAKFDHDERLALAAYARGSGRVKAALDKGEPIPAAKFYAKVMRAKQSFAQALGSGRQARSRPISPTAARSG
jgi:soluble lytic murein transglycosylase-like protein